MSGTNAELIARARVAAEVFNHDHAPSAAIASTLTLLADALEAAEAESARAKAEALEESAKAIGWTLDAHWAEYADTDAPEYVTISTIRDSILAHAAVYREAAK